MLKKEINGFAESLDALRDFVDLIDPFLSEKHKEIMISRKDALRPLFKAIKNLDLVEAKSDLPSDKIEGLPKDTQPKEPPNQETTKDGRILKTVKIEVNEEDNPQFTESISELIKTTKQKDLLYQSSLLNLTNTCEWFLSRILHKYFDSRPHLINSTENVFSFNDLNNFGTVEDARRYLIDCKVENILRDSFEGWIIFFKSKASLSMGYLDKNKDKLIEVFQRRNLIVHNGGIVNSIYLSKVATALKIGVTKGEKISTSREYLDDAIGLFEEMFILIASELWKNELPEDSERGSLLLNIAYKNLVKERWNIAEGLSRFVMADKKMSVLTQLFGRINYWQSIKWQGRFNEIKNEVEKSDFSGNGMLLQLALHALKDDKTAFFELLPNVVTDDYKPAFSGHKIEYNDLEEFPIFREMRKQPEFEQFKQDNADKFSSESQNKETDKIVVEETVQ